MTTTTEGSTTESIPDIISVTETSEGKYYEPGELVFEDNFDFIDTFKWEHEITMAGGGNWEFQMYTHNRTNRSDSNMIHNMILQLTLFTTIVTLAMVFCTSNQH